MRFPTQQEGVLYLQEGGQETEIMYKFGHDLPEFAMFTLLDKPAAMAEIRGMYQRYLEVAVRHGFVPLMGGLDYRASPDWAGKLGYSASALADIQLQAIEFLREVARPYESQLPKVLYVGIVGPRGDAYSLNRTMSAEEAEEYHSVQIATLSQAKVDLVSSMTLNNIEEAVGIARAAHKADLALSVSFTLDSSSRLQSGPSIREAIEAVDARTQSARPDFYGINCSHPVEFDPALEPGNWILRVRSLRPNAAKMDKIELCQLGHLEAGDPCELGEEMGGLAERYPHLDVWGGCCGTWEVHLDEIARHVRQARS
jgi:homocysteine S-methyltransferase